MNIKLYLFDASAYTSRSVTEELSLFILFHGVYDLIKIWQDPYILKHLILYLVRCAHMWLYIQF